MALPQTFDTFWNAGDGAPDTVNSGIRIVSMAVTFNVAGRIIGMRRWRTASSTRMALGGVSSADGVIQAVGLFAVAAFPAAGAFERMYLHPYVPIAANQTVHIWFLADNSDVWTWGLKNLASVAALTRGHMTIAKNQAGAATVWTQAAAIIWQTPAQFIDNPYWAFDCMFQPSTALN